VCGAYHTQFVPSLLDRWQELNSESFLFFFQANKKKIIFKASTDRNLTNSKKRCFI
jgi:hypothetical protein